MSLRAPIPFIGPHGPGAPFYIRDSEEDMILPADIILCGHTINNNAATFTLSTTSGVTASGGVTPSIDHWIKPKVGDLLVLVMVGATTGDTASFAPNLCFIEGDTAGAYQNSTWAPDSTKTDVPVLSNPTAGNFVSVWSSRVDRSTFQGGFSVAVTGTFAGSTGIRRMYVYLVRPRFGYQIPDRKTRLIANGNVNSATGSGANYRETISMTWTYGAANVRNTTAEALLVVGAAAGGTGTMAVDADNDSGSDAQGDYTHYELGNGAGNFNDAPATSSTYVQSKGYKVFDPITPRRPSTSIRIQYSAQPGAHITLALVYALEPDPFPIANKEVGLALTAKAVPGGGPNTAPPTRGKLAFKGKAWPRSKYPPPTNHASAVAFGGGRASPLYNKYGQAWGKLAAEGLAEPFKPSVFHRPDQLIPPGNFISPAHGIFRQIPLLRENSFHGNANITGTGTINATGFTLSHGSATIVGSGAVAAVGSLRTLVLDESTLLPPGRFITPAHDIFKRPDPTRITAGQANITGTGTVSATGHVTKHGSANISGTGTINATGAVLAHGQANIVGTGTVAATGSMRSVVLDESGLLPPGNFISPAHNIFRQLPLFKLGTVILHGDGTISGTGTINATGHSIGHGSATIVGAGTVGSVGSLRTLVFDPDKQVPPIKFGSPATTIFARSMPYVQAGYHANANIIGSGTVNATGHATLHASATIVGTGTVSAAGRMHAHASCNIAGTGTISATARVRAKTVFDPQALIPPGRFTSPANAGAWVTIDRSDASLVPTSPEWEPGPLPF